MLTTRDVKLLIFDTDGTVVSSLQPVYESVKRVFNGLGWPVDFTGADIEKYFGMASGELYRAITPPDGGVSWQEVRARVIDELEATFREFGRVFPGVPETLGELRRRGYRLALISNGSVRYFETVTRALDIREYFDHLESIYENSLDKTGLVRKIRAMFGPAAVIGDRHHDIEAARETGSLSVGVRYGYGGDEPEQADITIDSFGELLGIFENRPE